MKHIHMIAICGTGMGAFAGLLVQSGYKVTGSDQNVYPPMSTKLMELGIKLMSPFSAENIADKPDLVIVGNAVRRTNPEAIAVMDSGIPYMSFPQALGEFFLKDRKSLVVAGTHGKTTTCSMTAWILEHAKKDPSFLIGGVLNNFDSNCKLGKGEYFVVEGDEYDTAFFDKGPKFMHYAPTSAILTSVEFDHGDIYKDIDHIKSAFSKFLKLIPKDGYLIACKDFVHVNEILPEASCNVETYGFSEGADWTAENIKLGVESSYDLTYKGKKLCEIVLKVPGKHNILNSVAASALLYHKGVTPQECADALKEYTGVKRRQEVRGVVNGITVLDDFAHHPTKVKATVDAIKSKYPNNRVWAIFEPRTNSSRRAFFQKDYVSSFDSADLIVIADVFNKEQIDETERFSSEKLSRDLVERGKNSKCIPNADEIVKYVAENASSGDVILIMSNGGFDNIHEKLLEELKKK